MTVPTALPGPSEPLFPGSIETYLVTDVPLCSPSTTVAELQRLLVGGRFDSVATSPSSTRARRALMHPLPATGSWG